MQSVTDHVDFSLVLACYNEGHRLGANVDRIIEALEGLGGSYELIFVDDCSSDGTPARIEAIVRKHPDQRLRTIFHDTNQGRGAAVSAGFRAASGGVLGFIDVDLEVDAVYLPACYEKVRSGADCVIGRRRCKVVLRRLHRILLSWGYQRLRLLMVGGPPCDTESGYKFFRREVLLPALDRVQDRHWFWDTEVIIDLARHGHTVEEVPCVFVPRLDKQSTVRLIPDILVYLRSLSRLRRRLREL